MDNGAILKRNFVALLASATAVNLVWAGAATFRVLIDLPARHAIGAMAFAELSRATDLSRGLVFYPVMAVGSALLSCASWFVARRTGAPRSIRLATAIAALATLLVLGITVFAAPLMFQIGSLPNTSQQIDALADRFALLTNLRALFAGVGGFALLSALTACAFVATSRSDDS